MSGYYNGSSCSNFLADPVSCRTEYSQRGAACSGQGRLGIDDCDVDSWYSCCLACADGLT